MKEPEHYFFQVPAHWIPALVHGELAVFEDPQYKSELRAFKEFNYHHIEHGTIVSVGQSKYFSTQHDARPYGVLPCEIVDIKMRYDD